MPGADQALVNYPNTSVRPHALLVPRTTPHVRKFPPEPMQSLLHPPPPCLNPSNRADVRARNDEHGESLFFDQFSQLWHS